ncbi:MAG: ATP-binding protein [Firmicutes bacterium]|uniref:ATP-binding protein n=1 Tax=Candidatus Alloenteromonas pullistercoris TaxID=2840785 RepID=A0A9D9DIJ4_9FIRM|nr:ATP-binding protein [Candidatus Enteromonas pullistercoris]
MEIKRDKYLDKLTSAIGNGLVKVIVGARRCGKSYLLFHLFKDYLLKSVTDEEHIIEINFDAFENSKLTKADECYRYLISKIKDRERYFFLLDEIQLLEKFESILNSFLNRNVDIYVTGSNSKMLSSDIATEFRGRGWLIDVFPLSFAEFKSVKPSLSDEGAFEEYFTYGGMPFVAGLSSSNDKIKYLKNLYKETYLKDIVDRNKLRNDEAIEDVLAIIASNIGCFTNVHKIASTFSSVAKKQISDHTIADYLGFLEDAFVLHKARRYDIKGRKYIGANDKYYFSDCGIRNAILNFRQTEPTHLMEQVIYNELLCRGYSVDVGLVETRVPNTGERKRFEVDFVCNLGSQRIYIQSAYRIGDLAKLDQEIRPFQKIEDAFRKILIIGQRTEPHYDDNGVLHMGLYNFLENEAFPF